MNPDQERRYWDVRVWWISQDTGSHWEAGCHVAWEHARTAREALDRCVQWRHTTEDLRGFSVELKDGE